MIGLAIIADDYTGGLMVASFIEQLGIPAPFVTDPSLVAEIGDHDVVVIGTRSRFASATEAVAEALGIAERLDAVGVDQVFQKYCSTFDSTDEGNIGPVADALARRYASAQVLFCPAFPDFRTFVHQGYMFYRDRLISESTKRFDPITPMADPDLVRVLQRQTETPVGLLPHHILHQGPTAAAAWLAREAGRGVRFVLMDAVDNDDIRCGATVVRDEKLVTGGDALAIELARQRRERTPVPSPRITRPATCRPGAGAVLAGSCGMATLDQLAHFERTNPVLRIALRDADEPGVAAQAALAWARARIEHGAIAVTTAADPEEVGRTQQALGVMGAARRAEQILALIAKGLFEMGVRRFLVSGGETAGAVIDALGIRSLDVLPADDLGAGGCTASAPAPMALFLKPGKVGPPDLFSRVLDRMA